MLAVTLAMQLAGLVTARRAAGRRARRCPRAGWAWGLAAGAVGCGALVIFYTALARGVMSLVAPVSAAGAIIPVTVALAGDADATTLALVGMAVAILGAAGCALAPGRIVLTREALVLAVLAAVGIGMLLALLGEASRAEGSSGLGAVLAARVAGFTVIAVAILALRRPPGAGGAGAAAALAIVPLVGVLDTAANATFAVASEDVEQRGAGRGARLAVPAGHAGAGPAGPRRAAVALQALAAVGAIGGAALASAA